MLTRTQIEELGAFTAPHCVSLYLPTHRAGTETHQGRIRLKNLLVRAEADLVEAGVRATVARDMLAPARALLDDDDFWLHQADGLALFLAPERALQALWLAMRVAERAVVSDRFYIKPLLPMVSDGSRFHILAVSLNSVRFFEAERDGIRERELRGSPHRLTDAVGRDWRERSLQLHASAAGSQPAGGGRHAVFHGHGGPADDEKAEIGIFLRRVDDAVCASVGSDRAPIVLAGVENITAAYRLVTRAPNVLPEGLDGNADQATAAELHHRALSVVEPAFAAAVQEEANRYDALSDTGRATDDLATILRAAFEGRVETLFVAPDEERWGTFDESTWTADAHVERRPGDRDLLDLAAVQCLRTGARVHALPAGMISGPSPIAAILRYQV